MDIAASADFQRRIGYYQDRALLTPVMVTRNGRERVVLISADEYKRLTRLEQTLQLPETTGSQPAPSKRGAKEPAKAS
jgi:prevent-host-death family protein